jgi:hypothetical protein
MKLSCGQECVAAVADLLTQLHGKGIRLWLDSGCLRYEAPRNSLSREELENLRLLRSQVVDFLESAAGRTCLGPEAQSPPPVHRAPLSFSQRAYWNLHRLGEGLSLRQMASAVRLCGRLDIEVMLRALAEVVQRHRALRTRIVNRDGVLMQEVDGSVVCPMRVEVIQESSHSLREAAVSRAIRALLLERIDLAAGPLFEVRLLGLAAEEHVLIVCWHHLIADAFSESIFFRDLFACYVQALTGCLSSLPEVQMHFHEFAARQAQEHEDWLTSIFQLPNHFRRHSYLG